MTVLCGWLPAEAQADPHCVVAAMGRALRAHAGQAWAQWCVPGLSIGLLELATGETPDAEYGPAVTSDGRYSLWMAGEAFADSGVLDVPDAPYTRTAQFRRALLTGFLRYGVDAIVRLNGEYQIALWDGHDRTLTLVNDRFGGLPLYWARSAEGFAFAGGVRGVLMAPGVPADPDADALRETVTFGGFRLGDRTNVSAVKMVPGASIVVVLDQHPSFRRYWHWADVPPRPLQAMPALIEEAHALWSRAIHSRLVGAKRPGQGLSGGLDSRAILAEASPQTDHWTAITYGVAGCDDARYAQRAAAAMGVTWVLYPLYSGRDPDWLDRRTGYIQQTDGLIQLVDLMHLEALPVNIALLDVHLSGYIGDRLCGKTYHDVPGARGLLSALPFYGTSLGWSWEQALSWAHGTVGQAVHAPYYAVLEQKYPQSIHRIFQAYAPWIRIRKPFTDYGVAEFFAGIKHFAPADLYSRLLRSKYPACFAAIPNQRTGLPVLTADWCVSLERARRYGWRQLQPRLAGLGLPARPRVRYYHSDDVFWRKADARARIEGTILRSGSLCCDILGREAVTQVVSDWFDRLAAPTQVVGALYVFEAYHRDVDGHLRAARAPR